MLIVGSHALRAHGIMLGRRPSDVDVIARKEDAERWCKSLPEHLPRHYEDKIEKKHKLIVHVKGMKPVEFEIASEKNPTALYLLQAWELQTLVPAYDLPGFDKIFRKFLHPEGVLALKMSHRYLKNSPYFRKTMDDILALRGLKYRVPPQLQDWLKKRQKETLNYGHPSLKRDKGKFFSGDGVNYKYEHDDIHEALSTIHLPCDFLGKNGVPIGVTTRARPAYVQFQKDADVDVSVSREKWDRCSEHVKLMSVLEESYVLALERSQIPCDFSIAPRTSFLIALEKVCTSITSGWWREYAWENYYRVLGMYSDDYVDRFQKALHEGKIREYQQAA